MSFYFVDSLWSLRGPDAILRHHDCYELSYQNTEQYEINVTQCAKNLLMTASSEAFSTIPQFEARIVR